MGHESFSSKFMFNFKLIVAEPNPDKNRVAHRSLLATLQIFFPMETSNACLHVELAVSLIPTSK